MGEKERLAVPSRVVLVVSTRTASTPAPVWARGVTPAASRPSTWA